MKYYELRKLWAKQRQLTIEWKTSLLDSAEKLVVLLESILQPQHLEWKAADSSKLFRTIDLVDITQPGKPRGKDLSESSITEIGELVFGIGLTFDEGPEVYPKSQYHLPVAIRFVEKQLEYAIYDDELLEADSWERDPQFFCEAIIAKFADYFEDNPFDAPAKPSSIGFLG